VGDDADLDAARLQNGYELLDQRRLSRADRAADADARRLGELASGFVVHRSIYLWAGGRRAAGSQRAISPSTVASNVCALTVMCGQASLCSMCVLSSLRVPLAGSSAFSRPSFPAISASMASGLTKHALSDCFARPNAPHCGRISNGSH